MLVLLRKVTRLIMKTMVRQEKKRSLDSSVLSQDEQPPTKVQRFELDTADSTENDWYLPTNKGGLYA